MHNKTFKIGEVVTYDIVSLSLSYRGVIIDLNRCENGGDCHVKWTRPISGVSSECFLNLRKLTEEESL